jgi:hypothetical protein
MNYATKAAAGFSWPCKFRMMCLYFASSVYRNKTEYPKSAGKDISYKSRRNLAMNLLVQSRGLWVPQLPGIFDLQFCQGYLK